MRPSLLLAAALLPLSAAAQAPVFDAQTGEPVPAARGERPAAVPEASAGGGALTLLQHLPEGSTKLVRLVGPDHVLVQNGAALVVAEVVEGNAVITLVERSRVVLRGQPTDAVVVGDRAYVAVQKGGGLVVLDVSDPASVAVVGEAAGFDAFAVAVAEPYVYVGRGTAGVRVYDATNPAAPVQVASFDTPGSANGLDVRTGVLFVADGNVAAGPELRLYDVTTPAAPALLGTAELGGFATYVLVREVTAYVAGAFGLAVVDVGTPAAPVVRGTVSLGGETAYELDYLAQTIYASGLEGFFVVDTTVPTAPAVAGTFPLGQGLGVAADGVRGVAYAADRFEGVRALHVANPAAISQRGFYAGGGFSHKAAFADGHLYVTDLGGGLRVLDVRPLLAGSGQAVEVGRLDLVGNTQHVLVRGGHAYVTDADFDGPGLTIVDVSDPAAPAVAGTYAVGGPGYGMDAAGGRLYLATGFGGFRVLGLASPAAPTLLGSTPLDGSNLQDVAVDSVRSVVFAVSFGGGMFALDVADPAAITTLDHEAWGFLPAIALTPFTEAFVADGQVGLRRVSTWNPSDLYTIVTTSVLTQARDVAMGWGIHDAVVPVALVADDFYGLWVIGDAGQPVHSFASADRGIGVAVCRRCYTFRDLVALEAGEAGVYLFSSFPFVAGEPGADGSVLRLEDVQPNPVRGAAAVRLALASAMEARVEVFDALGRRVAVLHDGPLVAGSHVRPLDAAGWAPGVYVVRLAAGGEVASTRLSVAR